MKSTGSHVLERMGYILLMGGFPLLALLEGKHLQALLLATFIGAGWLFARRFRVRLSPSKASLVTALYVVLPAAVGLLYLFEDSLRLDPDVNSDLQLVVGLSLFGFFMGMTFGAFDPTRGTSGSTSSTGEATTPVAQRTAASPTVRQEPHSGSPSP